MLYAKPEKRKRMKHMKSNDKLSFNISAEVDDSDYDVLRSNFRKEEICIVLRSIVGQHQQVNIPCNVVL